MNDNEKDKIFDPTKDTFSRYKPNKSELDDDNPPSEDSGTESDDDKSIDTESE